MRGVKPRFELPGASDDATWKCFIRRQDAFDFNWHHHVEYEVTLVTEGCGTRYVGTTVEPYRPGDLVLLGPDLPHTFSSEPYEGGVAEAAVAQFRHDFLGPGFFDLPQFASIAALLARSARGALFSPAPEPVRRILTGLPDLEPAAATVALLDALDRLARTGGDRPLTGPGYTTAPDADVSRRIDTVCRHLQEAHHRPVKLSDVAALVHMAPTSFSRFFRRTMGRTLTDYVNQLRIETACRLLITTELPITDVAVRSGYQNLSNFNRRFLELKSMRPREYRRTYRAH